MVPSPRCWWWTTSQRQARQAELAEGFEDARRIALEREREGAFARAVDAARTGLALLRELAPEAAGVIHSDLQRGFIRAETTAYDDLVAAGSRPAAREAGKLRIEGKDYEVQDGDVIEFRFKV